MKPSILPSEDTCSQSSGLPSQQVIETVSFWNSKKLYETVKMGSNQKWGTECEGRKKQKSQKLRLEDHFNRERFSGIFELIKMVSLLCFFFNGVQISFSSLFLIKIHFFFNSN